MSENQNQETSFTYQREGGREGGVLTKDRTVSNA